MRDNVVHTYGCEVPGEIIRMNLIKNICLHRELKQRIAKAHVRLYRVAYAWGHDPDLASDMAQETIAKALKKASQLREPEKLESWMFGIMTNCWRDHFRRTRECTNIDDIELHDNNTPDRMKHKQDIVTSVREAISRLPASQRYVVTLVDLEGFSYAEVAGILDIPVGTVMSRLSRARKQLAAKLLDYKVEHELPGARPQLRSIV